MIQGKTGVGSSARYELSQVIVEPLLNEGKELAEVSHSFFHELCEAFRFCVNILFSFVSIGDGCDHGTSRCP